jgi:hypothetical protein
MSISRQGRISRSPGVSLTLAVFGLVMLSGCDDAGNFNLKEAFAAKPEAQGSAAPAEGADEFIEQDVEAPDVFKASEPALWDGRPSLGGVWVAHPDVKDPERVMIRNTSNGKFVVGALFRREREIPGPRLQLSSDAAVALDILAGAPVDLDVVALRKEKIPVAPPEPEVVEAAEAPIDAPQPVTESTLDPIAVAGAAIDSAEPTPVETTAAQPAAPVVQSTLPVSRLDRPFIQVGIFNRAANAEVAADQMRTAGMVPTVLEQSSGGKAFWRVIVGPATTASERNDLQTKIRDVGYSDAYPVAN